MYKNPKEDIQLSYDVIKEQLKRIENFFSAHTAILYETIYPT